MSIDRLAEALPAYARDLAANLRTVAQETTLNAQQKWGAFLASAHAAGGRTAIREIAEEIDLSAEAQDAAKAAAAIMAMNNVYYRTLHQMKNREYAPLPARLRMGVVARPGVVKLDFELWCVAVSAINGCAACLDSHEDVLRHHGVSAPVVQAAIRIAAVVSAVSRTLQAEEAMRD